MRIISSIDYEALVHDLVNTLQERECKCSYCLTVFVPETYADIIVNPVDDKFTAYLECPLCHRPYDITMDESQMVFETIFRLNW